MLNTSAATPAGYASLREQVGAAWAEVFGMPQPPQADAHFFELGGNSLMAARLLARTRELTGRALPLSALLQAPTIEQFAALLERDEPESGEHAVCARSGRGRPVFLVHGLSGTVMECWPLISLLRSARPVYGFQARGLDDGLAPREQVEDIARAYVDHLRRVQPEGPYSLWGFSFGGVVALEIGRLLVRDGQHLQHVGLIDTYVRQDLRGFPAARDALRRTGRRLRHQSLRELGAYALERMSGKPSAISVPASATPAQKRVHEAMSRALERYRPEPFVGGPVAYLRAAVPLGGYGDPLPVWQRTAATGLVVVPLPGGHLDLVRKTSAHAAQAIDSLIGS